MIRTALLLLYLLCACTPSPVEDDTQSTAQPVDTSDTDTVDDTDTRPEGTDQIITVFNAEGIHFTPDNRRTVDVEVTFPPATETYSAVTGAFRLHCPNNRCDWWDRYATFGIVLDAEGESPRYVELDRFITPYRVGFSWETDLTPLRPLLTDTVTLRVFIDTWVGEGHEQGDGWLFDAEIAFTGGPAPSPEPIAVLPVWPHQSWKAGLDDNPVENQVLAQNLTLPAANSYRFRSFITGHGWNNQQNCAEFCPKEHFFTVAGEEFGREIWRRNCGQTVTDGVQMGTWEYDRAGWCPGAQVKPWNTDITAFVGDAEAVDFSYRLEDFTWLGDGDQPFYYLSGLVIAYN